MSLGTNSAVAVVVVDYGTGNLHSVKKVVERTAANCVISSNARDIERADKIILPGVGHFGTTMSTLKRLSLLDALNEAVLCRRKPVLGICLGMALMARRGEEGDATGLGWLDAESVRFSHRDTERYKVPHIGWNQVAVKKCSPLMYGVPDGSEFYFAHAYYLKLGESSCLLGETEYETTFASAIEADNIFGVQFHPEKSHDAGRQLLTNFIRM